jgi:hypothetical protein
MAHSGTADDRRCNGSADGVFCYGIFYRSLGMELADMKTIIEMAHEAGIELDLIDENEGQIWYITTEGMKAFAALVRADEREACAKVCDKQAEGAYWEGADACAELIRARGQA